MPMDLTSFKQLTSREMCDHSDIDVYFLVAFCRARPEKEVQEFFSSMNSEPGFSSWIRKVMPNTGDLERLLTAIPPEKISIVLHGLGEEILSSYFIMSEQLINAFLALAEKKKVFFNQCANEIPSLKLATVISRDSQSSQVTRMAVLMRCLVSLNDKQRKAVLALLTQDELLQVIRTGKIVDLRQVSSSLSDEYRQQIMVDLLKDQRYLSMMDTESTSMVSDIGYLAAFLTAESILQMYSYLEKKEQSASFVSILFVHIARLADQEFQVVFNALFKKNAINIEQLVSLLAKGSSFGVSSSQKSAAIFSCLAASNDLPMIKTLADLVEILPCLPLQDRWEVYRKKYQLIRTRADAENVFSALTRGIPDHEVDKKYQSLKEHYRILSCLPDEVLLPMGHRADTLSLIMESFGDDQARRQPFLSLLVSSGHLEQLTHTVAGFNSVMSYLSVNDRAVIYQRRRDWLLAQAARTATIRDFLTILDQLSTDHCREVCQQHRKHLAELVTSKDHWQTIGDHLLQNSENRVIVFLTLQDHLLTSMNTEETFHDRWKLLSHLKLQAKQYASLEEDTASWGQFCSHNLLLNFFILARRVGINELAGLFSGLTAKRQVLMKEVINKDQGYPLLIQALNTYAAARRNESSMTLFQAAHKQRVVKLEAVRSLVDFLNAKIKDPESNRMELTEAGCAALQEGRCGEIISAWEALVTLSGVKSSLNLSQFVVFLSTSVCGIELSTVSKAYKPVMA